MPLITTPNGLRYYRYSDRTKRIWQYRLQDGNWTRLPKPIRFSKGYGEQFTFGISHFSDPLKEPVVTLLAGGRHEPMIEFQWSIDGLVAGEVAVPDKIQKLVNGSVLPVLVGPSPGFGAPSSLWGKQWAFLTGGSRKFMPVELTRDAPTGSWEGREMRDQRLSGPTRVAACVNSQGLHLFTPGTQDGSYGLFKASRALDGEDYTVEMFLKVPDEWDITIDTALVAAPWDDSPRVFVLTRQRNSPARHVQECVFDAEENTMKLRQLTTFEGRVSVGMDGRNVVVAYEDRDEYGIKVKTLVGAEEEKGWMTGPDIDQWEHAGSTLHS
ncbi:hypothetical protein TARUN_5410 [Trichoderma arundinaceum]|uniref:Uncharacterized protein n=1 Tax=Trichoderma arundinaceum TaxID=490622 RepID=A0A395NLM6_TRIAR|nr:hypothetical protein TARUN_5410 [Trichoderma arundinaceum]